MGSIRMRQHCPFARELRQRQGNNFSPPDEFGLTFEIEVRLRRKCPKYGAGIG
jgi:hypothetical protein